MQVGLKRPIPPCLSLRLDRSYNLVVSYTDVCNAVYIHTYALTHIETRTQTLCTDDDVKLYKHIYRCIYVLYTAATSNMLGMMPCTHYT